MATKFKLIISEEKQIPWWQGPPNINKVRQHDIVLSFKLSFLFSLFSHENIISFSTLFRHKNKKNKKKTKPCSAPLRSKQREHLDYIFACITLPHHIIFRTVQHGLHVASCFKDWGTENVHSAERRMSFLISVYAISHIHHLWMNVASLWSLRKSFFFPLSYGRVPN